jgi:hypothetical protein
MAARDATVFAHVFRDLRWYAGCFAGPQEISAMKKLLVIALALLAPACMESVPEAADELAAEDADLGDLGAADAAGGLYTYYTVRQDFRRCIYPLCGGYWVSRVNRASTTCADGSRAEECYVAEFDYSALGLSEEEAAALRGQTAGGIFRGSIVPAAIGDFDVARFAATEAWVGSPEQAPVGVFALIEDSGIRCITSPCESLHESKLNSSLDSDIAELDLSVSGATDEQIAAAYQALGESGLIVAGYRYTVRGPGGRARARTGTAFWTRFSSRGGDAGGCFVGGCSGQVCTDVEGLITTCEWRDSYACYQTATCERQADGSCGWTETPELDACLAGSI